MLIWHKELWMIDHGASLYFHHSWDNWEEQSVKPFVQIKDHVLLEYATEVRKTDELYKPLFTEEIIRKVLSVVPDEWLPDEVLYGLSLELVMPSTSTRERTLTMEAFGAKVTLLESMEVCRDYAEDKAASGEYFILNQFANPDNYKAHIKTTGPEIWRDTEGKITHFVSAMGTTGTIMGNSMFLKEKNADIQIVGCQPTEESSIPGIRRWPQEYLPKIFDASRVDRVIDISQLNLHRWLVSL
ncbi:hypothetical protein FQR65_LT15429 [Abscondita terminalis]|nr:hypothetical protein FQR65_LT15429 [Abscondita terminalis]